MGEIQGFSKFSKKEKINWLIENYLGENNHYQTDFSRFWLLEEDTQKIFDAFSENTVSNYLLPYGLAPNFLIDNKTYCIPMVIEESSVVAAAASAAKYWQTRGGFKTTILGTRKVGHVFFIWKGKLEQLLDYQAEIERRLRQESTHLSANMEKRGGGIEKIEFLDLSFVQEGLFQLRAHFQTCNSMGANFINTILEQFGDTLENYVMDHEEWTDHQRDIDIIMAILSNYTPECVVRAEVSCPVSDIGQFENKMMGQSLAEKFCLAINIARNDVYRATTHNKGIFNGIDAVIIATGNDFRAVEAAGHAYAARDGQYRGLSHCTLDNGIFTFWIEIPLAIGTIGGLTALHPLAKKSLDILGNPSAEELMSIVSSVGLAQNFAAVKSLVTTGIQAGHMKMHLLNILNHLHANDRQIMLAEKFFEKETVSFAAVRAFLESNPA